LDNSVAFGKANRLTRPYRATVSPECIDSYNKLKLDKVYKFVIFKLSDDNKEIVVEEASADADWENFREKLINAQTKSKSVCSPITHWSRLILRPAMRAITYSYIYFFLIGRDRQGTPLRCLRRRVPACFRRGNTVGTLTDTRKLFWPSD